jgi:LysM repeat protein
MPELAPRSCAPRVRAAALLAGGLAGELLVWMLRPAATAGTPVGAIVLGCGWLGWLLASWLTLCVAACAAGQLVGHRVPRHRATVDRCVPRRLGRLVDAVVTAGLVGAVLGGSVAPATAVAGTPATAAMSHRVAGSDPLEWPGLADRHPAPDPPDPVPTALRSHAPKVGLVSAAPSRAAEREPVVTVRAGDSLWSIAAAALGPGASAAQIATQWPRWYSRNRAVIGDDPTLIRPGQRLRPPAGSTTDRAAHDRPGSSR